MDSNKFVEWVMPSDDDATEITQQLRGIVAAAEEKHSCSEKLPPSYFTNDNFSGFNLEADSRKLQHRYQKLSHDYDRLSHLKNIFAAAPNSSQSVDAMTQTQRQKPAGQWEVTPTSVVQHATNDFSQIPKRVSRAHFEMTPGRLKFVPPIRRSDAHSHQQTCTVHSAQDSSIYHADSAQTASMFTEELHHNQRLTKVPPHRVYTPPRTVSEWDLEYDELLDPNFPLFSELALQIDERAKGHFFKAVPEIRQKIKASIEQRLRRDDNVKNPSSFLMATTTVHMKDVTLVHGKQFKAGTLEEEFGSFNLDTRAKQKVEELTTEQRRVLWLRMSMYTDLHNPSAFVMFLCKRKRTTLQTSQLGGHDMELSK